MAINAIGTAQRDAVKHLLQKIEKLLGHKVTFSNRPRFAGGGITRLQRLFRRARRAVGVPLEDTKLKSLQIAFSSQVSGPITVFAPCAFKSLIKSSGCWLPVLSIACASD